MITGNTYNPNKFTRNREIHFELIPNHKLMTYLFCRYESTMARNLYEKLMTKYEANPEDPMAKFTKSKSKNSVKDPNSTLARMKEALSKGTI